MLFRSLREPRASPARWRCNRSKTSADRIEKGARLARIFKLEIRNAGLDAEVRDLKQGYDAIEERARFELGMIRQDEIFVQIPEKVPGK